MGVELKVKEAIAAKILKVRCLFRDSESVKVVVLRGESVGVVAELTISRWRRNCQALLRCTAS